METSDAPHSGNFSPPPRLAAIQQLPLDQTSLRAYADIPIAFQAEFRLDHLALLQGQWQTSAIPRFTKDYDALESPLAWPHRFDVRSWVMFREENGAGGAVVATHTPGCNLLAGHPDRALLWDLRVAPARRGRGVGRALLQAAVRWCQQRACTELRVETQDINPAACSFYAACGFRLAEANPDAYPGLDEVQLHWALPLPEG